MNIAFAGFRHSHILGLYNTALNEESISITGCFEENEQARKAAEDMEINFKYDSYQKLLEDSDVEIVAIGDYYGIRGQRVIEALEHGKHVICDKPLCTSLEELDKIESLVKEKNLKICIMLDLRYMPQTEKVKEIIASGELGKINIATFTGQHCLDYGKRPDWYFEDGKHGGTINDIAIHGIDLIRYITGKNLSKVDCAKTWNAFATQEPNFEDSAQFMGDMEGMAVNADVSYAAPKFDGILPTYWNFTLWGDKGMLNFKLCDNEIHIYKNKKEIITMPDRKIDYLCDFVKEINGENPKYINTMDMLASQRQVLTIQKASENQKGC